MDLQELIDRRREGRSLQKLADASGLTKQAWQPYVAAEARYPNRRVPEPRTILGMARALDVDVETIMLAIGEWIGVIPRERRRPALLDALPPHEVLELLEDDDVQTIVRFIALLTDLRAEAIAAEPQQPAAPAPSPRAKRRRAPAPRNGDDSGDNSAEHHAAAVASLSASA